MHSVPTRRRSPLATVATATTLLLLLLLAGSASRAGAASDDFSCRLSAGSYCSGARHSLRQVYAYNNVGRYVGAGASTTGSESSMYGSYGWGAGDACHSYAGSTVLYPLITNGSSTTFTVFGYTEYGTGADTC